MFKRKIKVLRPGFAVSIAQILSTIAIFNPVVSNILIIIAAKKIHIHIIHFKLFITQNPISKKVFLQFEISIYNTINTKR